jgi:uncharacterized membrane protein YedE/YeeE
MDFRRLPGVGEFLAKKWGRGLPTAATWDPSVLIVFAAALGTQLPLYHLFLKNRKQSLTGTPIQTPTSSVLDLKLIGGAALFGAGWALAGFCPGPALTSAFAGAPNAAPFLATVLLGMLSNQLLEHKFDIRSWLNIGKTTGLSSSLLGMGLVTAAVGFLGWYAPIQGFKSPIAPYPAIKFAIAGGVLIGLSGFAYTLSLGKVMGLSGMLSQHFLPTTTSQDRADRWTFLGGLASAALLVRHFYPEVFISSAPAPVMWKILLSGFMVGFGTSCSNGCTSGHGLAGISRFAVRSIVATAAFFGTNVLCSTLLF